MSWDIFVQDLPKAAYSIRDVPDDFEPRSIGKRGEIIRKILEVVPSADFSDPTWGTIAHSDFHIEVSMGDDEIVEHFAFHIRGGDAAAQVVADILDHLKLRAIDPGSKTGFFERETATEGLRRWRAYRDRVMQNLNPPSNP